MPPTLIDHQKWKKIEPIMIYFSHFQPCVIVFFVMFVEVIVSLKVGGF